MAASKFASVGLLCSLLLAANAATAEPSIGFDPFETYDPFGDVQLVSHVAGGDGTLESAIPHGDGAKVDIAFLRDGGDSQPIRPLAAHYQDLDTAVQLAEERPDPDAPDAKIPLKPLGELTTNITLPSGMLPRDYAFERPMYVPEMFDPCARTRFWPVTPLNWEPSCLTHNPLYFEEINLERYGYGCSCHGPCCTNLVQSAASGAHFFAAVPMLPYMMGADCPTQCQYTLGHYRPGSCPPWRPTCCTRPSCAGGVSTAAVATGIILLIP